jgi:hypothetical protein
VARVEQFTKPTAATWAQFMLAFEQPSVYVLNLRLMLSGTFSGLLAAAIENMDGSGGRPGWAWIFIPVCCFAIFSS